MIFFLVITTLLLSAICLVTLAIIDFKTRLLPNAYVVNFALLGCILHFALNFKLINPIGMVLGGLSAIGLLLIVRTIANFSYKRDTLGLGDVKLMGAAGLWLGVEYIFLAISIGAFAGLAHGLIAYMYCKNKGSDSSSLSTFSIPAGPGFIIGILVAAFFQFQSLPDIIEQLTF